MSFRARIERERPVHAAPVAARCHRCGTHPGETYECRNCGAPVKAEAVRDAGPTERRSASGLTATTSRAVQQEAERRFAEAMADWQVTPDTEPRRSLL
jgi:hypothetical protein